MASAGAPHPVDPGTSTATRGAPSGDLAAALHEVSNALTVALGWLETAAQPDCAPDSLRRAIEVALSRTRQGRDIARRAIGAEAAPDDEPCAKLGETIAETAAGLAPHAQARSVAIATTLDGDADALVRSAPTLVQVLTNLLLNALAHAPGSSTVRVEARADGGEIRLAVTDEGPGVPEHLREGLLERGASTRPGGAGIGLRHARALAVERGGSLRLAPSEAGARFELAWPAAPSDDGAPMSGRTSLAGTHVLVLEDDAAVADLLETALGLRGAEVVTVRTREELAAAAAARTFDAALLDLSPLEGAAASALAQLRATMPGGRLVLISGSATGLEPEVARLASAWVPKPFEIGEIAAALGAVAPGRGR